jgi:Bacteriophage head to tail connecting protein
MKISNEAADKLVGTLAAMRNDRQPWWEHWREVADYVMPRRYVWLQSVNETSRVKSRNPYILDATATTAARVLASGMMNGVTSPGRPWFKLRVSGFAEDDDEVNRWTEEVTRRLMMIMAESNFYNCMSTLYLDLVVFGTATMLIYEDRESVIRCYNSALGEFYIAQSSRQQVNTFARELNYKVHQVVERWGLDNCSPRVQADWRKGGAALQNNVHLCHLIEPNIGADTVAKSFKFRETYWEKGAEKGNVLARTGFHEFPGVAARWELLGNDVYGSSPAMDALGDIIQLQHETKAKAKGLDYMNEPPMLVDVQLQNRPNALMPRGITYVSGINNIGAKPAYQVQPPINEMTMDLREIQSRIKDMFHNPLFNMISQLDTVRTASEIDARKEEKLVLLGPVLQRFENEALDPAIARIFNIALRSKLLPEPPESIANTDIEIQYVSILSAAQRAVGVAPVERLLGVIGNIAAVYPKATTIPNWEELLYNYGRNVGVAASDINSPKKAAELGSAEDKRIAAQEAGAEGLALAKGAQTLSKTEVGGGANALQQLLGA